VPGAVEGSFRLIPAEEHRDDRSMWQGFSDALTHAVELVGTTVIFILLGLWLDNSIGTRPLFTVVLGLLAVIGLGVNTWLQAYTLRMNSAVVIVGVLFFGWLWGAWGLFLAVPLLAVLKAVADRIPQWQVIAEFLAE